MNLQIIDTINLIVGFQLALFGVFLFMRNTVPNRMLAVFLLAETVVLLEFVVIRSPQLAAAFPRQIHYFVHPFKLLWGPAFYFYIVSLVTADSRPARKLLLHTVPFWVLAGWIAVVAASTPPGTYTGPPSSWEIFTFESGTAFSVVVNAQITAYCIAGLWTFYRYRNTMKQTQSTLKLTNVSWLRFIVYGYCIAHLVSMGSQALIIWTQQPHPAVDILVYGIFFVFFNAIFFNAWTHPGIFSADEEQKKYKTSSLAPGESQSYGDRISEYMRLHRPYLKPELSLTEVAENLAIPPRHVSQVINERFGQNFFDFVNSYRVDEAKRMLSDPKSAKKTVLEILYESGFNTKSSFYLAFKKATGVAPKEFKKTYLAAPAPLSES